MSFCKWNVAVFIIDLHAKMGELAPLPSVIKFSGFRMEKERLSLLLLFATTCTYTDDRSKNISYHYIKEKAFITAQISSMGYMECTQKQQCPIHQ